MNWQSEEENQENRRHRWRLLLFLVPLLGLLCLAGTLFGQSFFNSRRPEFIPIDLHSLLTADYTANPNAPRIPGLRFDIIWDAILDRDPNAKDLEERKKALLSSLQTPVAVATRPACKGVHVIHATRDTWVSSTDPTATHGRDTFLQVGRGEQGRMERIFLYFPLTDVIPQGTFIYDAQLEMDLETRTGPAAAERIRFSSLANPFSELTTDWSNQPEPIFFYRTVTGLDPQTADFHAWDVTDVVQDWLLSDYQNEGVVLAPQPPAVFSLTYFSREADSQTSLDVAGSSDRIGPRLIVNCGYLPPTPEGVAGGGTPTPNPTLTKPSVTPPPTVAPTTTSLPLPSPAAVSPTPFSSPTSGPPVTAQPSPTPGSPAPTSTSGPTVPPPPPTDDDDDEDPTSVPSAPTSTPTPVVADISLSKSDSADPVVAGNNLIYTLDVVNNGPSTATGVTVVDTLPAGVPLVSITSSQGNCTGTTCQVGTLANGGTATITIEVTVNSDTTTSLSNSANASANETDPNPGNNNATETTGVSTSADLTIAKTDSSDPVVSGGDLTYTLTVTNSGPSDATGITLSDTLPTEVSFGSASSGCTQAGGTVDCTIGDLTAGSSSQVTITVTVNPAVINGTIINNTATTSGDQTDSNTGNNSATEPTTIDKVADLAIAKSDDPDPVVAGEALTYTLTITNNGPSEAANVVMTDTLPADVTYDSASPGCSASGGTVVCTLASLAVNASTQFQIYVDLNPNVASPLTNNAEVASDTADTTSGNDSVSETTTVTAETDLAISKSDDPDPVVAGQTLTYTLSITNNGPSSAAVVTTTDTLPAGVSLVSVSPSQGNCTGTTCTLGAMANGDTATVDIVVSVNSDTTNSLTNTAGVLTSEADPNSANDSATETTTVNPLADLSVSKTVNNATPYLGDTITFTVSINNGGAGQATNVTLADPLPAAFGYVSHSPSQGVYDSGTGDWDVGNLSNGQTVTMTLVTTATSSGVATNTAQISASDQTDPDSTPNNSVESEDDQDSAGVNVQLPTLSINDVTVTEGDSGTITATFSISLSTAIGVDVSVDYATSDNTATQPADYQTAGGTAIFPAGTTVQTFTVQINGDTLDENDETYTVTLSSPSNATLADGTGVGTILDDDNPSLSIEDVSVTEGDSGITTAVFTVTLSAVGVQTATVNYNTANGTATTANSDYNSAAGSLSFSSGITQQTITVDVVGDTTTEPDETFYVNLSSPSQASIADGQGVGTILNDDGTPVCSSPVVTQTATADTYLRENQVAANFGNSSTLETKPGSASPERRALIRFDLSGLVPAGSSISCASVTLHQSATGPSAQTINIHRVTTAWVEGNGNTTGATWNKPDKAAAANWSTAGGDYDATVAGSFVPTDTIHIVNITSLAQFWVANPASNYGLLLAATGTDNAVVSYDSREGTNPPELVVDYVPGLVISDTTVLEGNSGTTLATITVTLTSSSTNTISVDYATADNTATTTDNDYVGGNGSLTFNPGEMSKTFTVTINGDLKHEGDETFFVNLSSPSNAGIADGQGSVTILNDEAGGFLQLPGTGRRIFLPVIFKR